MCVLDFHTEREFRSIQLKGQKYNSYRGDALEISKIVTWLSEFWQFFIFSRGDPLGFWEKSEVKSKTHTKGSKQGLIDILNPVAHVCMPKTLTCIANMLHLSKYLTYRRVSQGSKCQSLPVSISRYLTKSMSTTTGLSVPR